MRLASTTALRMAAVISAIVAASHLHGENLVKLEIAGESYVIDIDSGAVQQNLRPANPQAGAAKLPSWLYPSPGQVPLRSNYDARTGIADAAFASGGTPSQVLAYYQQLLASKGYATGGPVQPTAKIVSGKSAAASVSVMASTPSAKRGRNGIYSYLRSRAKHFDPEAIRDRVVR